ncbi:class I SAM-dependent methyltransferase [Gammaproteobacteria bacterium]|nr:class I SAM-dependent methyltransferase [Gammaproteobacteria bacterium]|tara:strand:- start:14451 stop:15266 length:816 start_codon:yes stop_codon:yes gene_type:complete
MQNITISCDLPLYLPVVKRLSDELGIALSNGSQGDGKAVADPNNQGYALIVSEHGISLHPNDRRLHGPIRVDFHNGANTHRRKYGGGNGQAIAKAVGVSGRFFPSVLDLTAGLGGDSFVLASLGCDVRLFERNAIIACLLRDGIERAIRAGSDDPELRDVMGRLKFLECDSTDVIKSLTEEDWPDVIYLDPMFPHRKKSAKVKKEMQAFQNIVGGDDDADALLKLAIDSARYRVVVKRSTNAEFLADLPPTYSLTGKSTRFDIFALRKIPS